MPAPPRRASVAAVLAVVLVLVALAAAPAAVRGAATIGDFTPAQQSNTRAFLLAFTDTLLSDVKPYWTGTDFCGWLGVTCTAPGELQLSFPNYYASQPGHLPEVPADVDPSEVTTSVVYITSFGNKLVGTLPPSWAALRALTSLTLASDALTGTIPPSWSSLTSLTLLNLGANNITGTLPASWYSMSAMQTLFLDVNSLTGTIPATWGEWPSLKSIFLSGNQLTGCVPAQWETTGVEFSVDPALELATCGAPHHSSSSGRDPSSSSATPVTTSSTMPPTPDPILPSSSHGGDSSFAGFISAMCPTASAIPSADLEGNKDEVCCSDVATTATLCGDRIRLMLNGRVACSAPQLSSSFTCCADVGSAGNTTYVGTKCPRSNGTVPAPRAALAAVVALVGIALMAAA